MFDECYITNIVRQTNQGICGPNANFADLFGNTVNIIINFIQMQSNNAQDKSWFVNDF